jgi:uncharacterized protein (TIGR04376 family)
MGLFDDLSRLLEERLDEFLRNNPHLELQALEEKLREQEQETLRLVAELRVKEKQLQAQIIETAQEIQRWHMRIEKAQAAGRVDLAEPAQAHEAALLREGNQRWGQMEMLKDRIKQAEDLQRKIQTRRQTVQTQVTQAAAARVAAQAEARTVGWSQSQPYIHKSADPLEQEFARWEAEEELNEMKRTMGK